MHWRLQYLSQPPVSGCWPVGSPQPRHGCLGSGRRGCVAPFRWAGSCVFEQYFVRRPGSAEPHQHVPAIVCLFGRAGGRWGGLDLRLFYQRLSPVGVPGLRVVWRQCGAPRVVCGSAWHAAAWPVVIFPGSGFDGLWGHPGADYSQDGECQHNGADGEEYPGLLG